MQLFSQNPQGSALRVPGAMRIQTAWEFHVRHCPRQHNLSVYRRIAYAREEPADTVRERAETGKPLTCRMGDAAPCEGFSFDRHRGCVDCRRGRG